MKGWTSQEFFEMTFENDPGTTWAWDVTRAKRMVSDGREVVTMPSLELGHFVATYTVDKEYAMKTDPGKPLLVVLVERRNAPTEAEGMAEAVLIDGVHRLYKAIATGRETVDLLILEPEEERMIRLKGEE